MSDDSDTASWADVREKGWAALAKGGSRTATVGGSAGKSIKTGLQTLLELLAFNITEFLYMLTRWGPLGKVWKRLGLRFLYLYYRSTGADRLAMDFRPNGDVDFVPVNWRPPEIIDDDEKPGWKATTRDKVWRPNTLDQNARLDKVPVVPVDSESWQAASVLQARVAEAVDQGDHRPLYNVEQAELETTIEFEGSDQAAVADGGGRVTDLQFNPKSAAIFEDVIIDLNSGRGYDGAAISFEKCKELMMETTTTEEMDNQETRGYFAGRSGRDYAKLALKLLIVAGLIIVGVEVGPIAIKMLFGAGGGGGGGGGGMIPPLGGG